MSRGGRSPHAAVLQAAWRAQSTAWRWWLLALAVPTLVMLAVAARRLWLGQPVGPVLHPMAVFMLGLPLAAGQWCLLVSNLMAQNQPTAARLVPDHPQVVQRVLLGAWAGFSLFTGALVASLFPLFWLVSGVVAAAGLALLAMSMRYPAAWSLPALTMVVLVNAPVRREALALLEGPWQAAPWLAALLVVSAAGLALTTLKGDGGERHRRRHDARRLRVRAMQGPDAGRADASSYTQPLGRERGLHQLAHRLYHWRVAKLLARPGGDAWPRLMLGMGPALHPTTLASQMLIATGIAMVFIVGTALLLPVSRDQGLLRDGYLMSFCVITMQLQFMAAATSLRRTRREQALLRLVPGAPGGQQLNHRLARSWGRQHLQLLLAAGVLGAGLCVLLDPAGLGTLWPLRAPALMAMALPFGALMLWRDWSRVATQDGVMLLMMVALLAAEMALAALLWVVFGRTGAVPEDLRWSLATLTSGLLAAAVVLPWRWRRMQQAPVAWPVGRMARL